MTLRDNSDVTTGKKEAQVRVLIMFMTMVHECSLTDSQTGDTRPRRQKGARRQDSRNLALTFCFIHACRFKFRQLNSLQRILHLFSPGTVQG